VYLSDSIYRELRRHARATGRSYTDLALDAIETHLSDLHDHWARSGANLKRDSLFPRRQPARPRREEPTRQIQLRLQANAAATLRRLAADYSAPSITAFVDEALRRELTN
jgi:hypothetical protein